jgi:thiazole synthase
MTTASNQETEDHRLSVGARTFGSRLLVGTGKYADLAQARAAIDASGAELVTLAVRRANLGQDPDAPNLLDYLPPERFTLLPNTAGCYSAREAVRTCELARELLGGHNLAKLEVIGDERTLYPDVPATLAATEQLVAAGFEVMAYTSDDPIMARRLEDAGAVAVMPLAAPIGSGLGIQNRFNLLEIVEHAGVPVLVDAGVGTASDVAIAMELGCDGVLLNTAIAQARDPIAMARAMHHGLIAGRAAWRAGRMPARRYATASSPVEGTIAAGGSPGS